VRMARPVLMDSASSRSWGTWMAEMSRAATIRDHDGGGRRAFVRFFACEHDLSRQPPDTPLPEALASGAEPYLIVGAVAGG
jgi:hypothetical protein